MIRDRVYGVKETLYHDPYYQRHIVGTPRVLAADGDAIRAEANYTVVRTKYDGEATVFSAGHYRDEIVRTPEGLRFRSRLCIYDTEMIANSVILPHLLETPIPATGSPRWRWTRCPRADVIGVSTWRAGTSPCTRWTARCTPRTTSAPTATHGSPTAFSKAARSSARCTRASSTCAAAVPCARR